MTHTPRVQFITARYVCALSARIALARESMLHPACKSLPAAPAAVVTIVDNWSNKAYVRGAAVLGSSAKHFADPSHARLLAYIGRNGSEPLMNVMQQVAGWSLCTIPFIAAPGGPKEDRLGKMKWAGTWSKLAVFSLSQYKRLIYLDADTLIVAPLSPLLLGTPLPDGVHLASGTEATWTRWVSSRKRIWFNCGVLVIKPSDALYTNLTTTLSLGILPMLRKHESDSDFLNSFWSHYNMGHTLLHVSATGNLGIFRWEPRRWAQIQLPVRIVHYTLQKPWELCKGSYMQFCSTWSCFWDGGVGRALETATKSKWGRDHHDQTNATELWDRGWYYNTCNASLDLVRHPECARVHCRENRKFADCKCPAAATAAALPAGEVNSADVELQPSKSPWRLQETRDGAGPVSALPIACQSLALYGHEHPVGKMSADARLKGGAGGAWTACTHIMKYGMQVEFETSHFILHSFRPNSTLELGAGLGLYSSILARQGVARTVALEPFPMVPSAFAPGKWPVQLLVDVTNPTHAGCLDGLVHQSADVVFTMEVLEHIPRAQHHVVADFLSKAARGFLVFSAARRGQGGTGHIANRLRTEWHDEFTTRGLTFLPRTTAALLGACCCHCARNALVFAARSAPLGLALDGAAGRGEGGVTVQPGTHPEAAASAGRFEYCASLAEAGVCRGCTTVQGELALVRAERTCDQCRDAMLTKGTRELTPRKASSPWRCSEIGLPPQPRPPSMPPAEDFRLAAWWDKHKPPTPRMVTLPGSGRQVPWYPGSGLRKVELETWPELVEQQATCAGPRSEKTTTQ